MASKTTAAEAANVPATQDQVAGAVSTELAADFEDFAGLGMENVKPGELLVPRLAILQALSPQINKRKAEHIPDAEVGSIADVGLGQLVGRPNEGGEGEFIEFIPVYYRKDYIEWAPRETGGGLVNIHSDPEILSQTRLNERKKNVLPNGNIVEETAQFYGFIVQEDGEIRPAFIPMSSTQLKKARKWLTFADGEILVGSKGKFKAPLFYRIYRLGTVPEDNQQGDWIGWTINRADTLPERFGPDFHKVMNSCKDFIESLHRGNARGDLSGFDGNEGGVIIDSETGESREI